MQSAPFFALRKPALGARAACQAALALAALALAGCGGGGGGTPDTSASTSTVTPSSEAPASSPTTSTASVNLVADGYVPMAQGDSWVYDLTDGGQTTTAGLTRSVTSGPDAQGQTTVHEAVGSTGSDEQYVVNTAGVAWVDPGNVSSYLPGLAQAWPSWLIWANVTLAPGETRTVDLSGDAGIDYDGDQQSETYRLHAVQTFKGLETMTVLGQATQVARVENTYSIEITLSGDHSTHTVSATDNLALAPGLGMVQATRTEIGFNGNVTKQQQLVLRSAHVAGVDHGN